MAISLHSNINALNANSTLTKTNKQLENSLARLSTGFRLNKASDDAAGMTIADSLRSQAKGLGQAIKNANDAIGIIQIADSAMHEQINIIDSVRQKAIQSAQDTQTASSRKALHSDIVKLLEEFDNIARTTTYNGKALLSGGFTNKKFQIGAYSNETINASIAGTSSNKIGQTRFVTGATIRESTDVSLKFLDVNGIDDIELENIVISTSAGTGLGALSEAINKMSNDLQVRANYKVQDTGQRPIGSTRNVSRNNPKQIITNLTLNGISLGTFNDIQDGDKDSKIVAAINYYSSETSIQANVDSRGHLELVSTDGRGIIISADKGFELLGFDGSAKQNGKEGKQREFYGRLTLIRNDARDINMQSRENTADNWDNGAVSIGINKDSVASSIVNLRNTKGGYSLDQACAIGNYANASVGSLPVHNIQQGEVYKMGAGVTTYRGAQAVIDIADTALKMLAKIRSDLGSTQLQLEATVRNISSTKTNVKFSESQIRDADYGSEIQNFTQKTALVNAGNYSLVQANNSLRAIEKLLQY